MGRSARAPKPGSHSLTSQITSSGLRLRRPMLKGTTVLQGADAAKRTTLVQCRLPI